jgi:hypothetical protein
MTPEQEKTLAGELATPKIMLRRLWADVKRMVEPKPIPGRIQMTMMMLLFSQKYIKTPTIN